MNIEQNTRQPNIRNEMRRWLKSIHWDVAATFTFADDLTERRAQQTMRRFWNIVDDTLYGNQKKRRLKRCTRINIIEGGKYGQRIHYHCAVQMPSDRFHSSADYCRFLNEIWREQFGRHFKVQINALYDANGWSRYITKNVNRNDCDTIDVYSSHIAAPGLQNTLSQ